MEEKAKLAKRKSDKVDYRVQVAYRVPVEVIVDPKRGTVERVAVMDELVSLDQETGARSEGLLEPIPCAVAERAIEIAEEGDWPGWESGL